MATIENALWNQILKALLYPIKQLDLYFIGNSKHTEVLKQVRTWYIFFQEITVNSMEDKLKAPKNGCFQTVVLEKALESHLDCKEIKPVNPKGNQSWIFIGRTDAVAETPILWPPDVKSQFIGKDPDAGKDWRWEENWTTEDEMVGWHHQLNGHEFEQAQGVGDGQGSLACCNP